MTSLGALVKSWLFESPLRRRLLIRAWRLVLRAQRATLANAQLILRRRDGCLLAEMSPDGDLRLPQIELDAWTPISAQIEGWIERLKLKASNPELVAVDGVPGAYGITFVYTSMVEGRAADADGRVWLEAEVAAARLGLEARLPPAGNSDTSGRCDTAG
jgi:hypothetical protein